MVPTWKETQSPVVLPAGGVVEFDGEASGGEDVGSGGPGGPVEAIASSEGSGGVLKADAVGAGGKQELVAADVLLESKGAKDDVGSEASGESASGRSSVEVGGIGGVEVILEEDGLTVQRG